MDLLERGFIGKYQKAVAAKPTAAGIRIGRLYVDGTDPRIDRAVDAALAAKGFHVVVLSKWFKARWEQAEKDARTVAAASAWLSDQKFANEPEVRLRTKAVVALGAYEYRTNYRDALRRKEQWKATLRQTFKTIDFIALPTLKKLPPKVPWLGGTPALEAQVLGMQNTTAVNLGGNPALALPVPVDDKVVPVASLQLIGPLHSEAALLNAGRLVEGLPPDQTAAFHAG
jgi:Asp-tRNA(Asn)/Glu-tRNA(Gln) amidotransferase A subunit family amidase